MRRNLFVMLNLVTLSACGGDRIHVVSLTNGDSPSVLVSGRRNLACKSHDIWSGSPDADVANFQEADLCPSEAAVFASGTKMALQDTATQFTNSGGDVINVTMAGAPYDIPVNVFVMVGDRMTGQVPPRLDNATESISLASTLWDGAQCGVTFSLANPPIDATAIAPPVPLLTASCVGHVADFKAVAAAALQNGQNVSPPKVINVFYTELDANTHGETCSDGNGSAVILVGQWNGPATLAHELGHALSLQHSEAVPQVPGDNLMISTTPDPATITTGQCFRANTNTKSVLNSMPIRTGPTRDCDDTDVSQKCPALSLRK